MEENAFKAHVNFIITCAWFVYVIYLLTLQKGGANSVSTHLPQSGPVNPLSHEQAPLPPSPL